MSEVQDGWNGHSMTLQSIVDVASRASSPAKIRALLQVSPTDRGVMVDEVAKLAIFSAFNVSSAVGRHAGGVDDEDATKNLYRSEANSEELSVNDGRILELITHPGDIFRYRLARTLHSHLSSNDHPHEYQQCMEENPRLDLPLEEKEVLLRMLRRSHNLAHFSQTVVSIPELKNLPKVQEALMRHHTRAEIFSITDQIPIEYMEDAWELEGAHA